MLALYLAGALSNFNFPTKLTPELVKAINYYPDPDAVLHTEQMLHELQLKGDHQLANALLQATKKRPSAGHPNALEHAIRKTKSLHKIFK